MELRDGDTLFIDAAVRETSETTIRVQENLTGFPVGHCLGGPLDDGLGRFRLIGSWIDAAEADLPVP